jgi:phage-related protein
MDERPAKVLAMRFYASRTGMEPVREWLKALPRDARRAIGADLKTVEFGWPLGMPLVRKLGSGLWEVRCTIPHGIARVLFTVNADSMILLHGFVKKSQKVPKTELELAKRRLKEVHDEQG